MRAIENGYGPFHQDFDGPFRRLDHLGSVLGMQDTTTPGPHLFLADVPCRGGLTIYQLTGDVFA